jgi:hypothetical protein
MKMKVLLYVQVDVLETIYIFKCQLFKAFLSQNMSNYILTAPVAPKCPS